MFNKKLKTINVLIIIVVLILVAIPTINTIRGEGLTFTSILAIIETRQFFEHIEKGNFDKAANVIDLTDDINQKFTKSKFVSNMENLFSSSNLELVSYKEVKFKTDDRYTMGTVELIFRENDEIYEFILKLSRQNGTLCPMSIVEVDTSIEATLRADSLSYQLDAIWSTHNPN